MKADTAAAQAPEDYRGATAKLLLLASGLFIVGTNASVIAGLLPNIATGLKTTQGMVSYSITIYAVIVAIVAPVTSIVLVQMPRAALMATGASLFSIGTVVAASSHDVGQFYGGRAIAAFGGAALVPTATALATSLVPPERRGRALATVTVGFTLSGALGTPLGTVLGNLVDWRFPMWVLAGIGVLVGVGIAVGLRGVPRSRHMSIRHRLAPLADRRVVGTVCTTLFLVASFNVVFIFSAMLTEEATGGAGILLAVLLMVYGCSGVVGNLLAGPITDRYGSRYFVVVALGGVAVMLVILPFVLSSYALCLVVFAVWGLVASGTNVPIQHRLVNIDPEAASITMAWNSTAMYVGISVSPPLGNIAIELGGATAIPFVGAICALVGMLMFTIGLRQHPRDNFASRLC